MKRSLSYFIGISVILISGFSLTNPGSVEYETHELIRFRGSSSSISYKNGVCIGIPDKSYIALGDIDAEAYKSICEGVVSEFESNPEKLLTFIRGNTKRVNLILLSSYVTDYSEIHGQIIEKVKQHPLYRPSTEARGIPGGRAYDLFAGISDLFARISDLFAGVADVFSDTHSVGITGKFIDSRKW